MADEYVPVSRRGSPAGTGQARQVVLDESCPGVGSEVGRRVVLSIDAVRADAYDDAALAGQPLGYVAITGVAGHRDERARAPRGAGLGDGSADIAAPRVAAMQEQHDGEPARCHAATVTDRQRDLRQVLRRQWQAHVDGTPAAEDGDRTRPVRAAGSRIGARGQGVPGRDDHADSRRPRGRHRARRDQARSHERYGSDGDEVLHAMNVIRARCYSATGWHPVDGVPYPVTTPRWHLPRDIKMNCFGMAMTLRLTEEETEALRSAGRS